MDSQRFDAFVQTFGRSGSRREVLRGLPTALLAAAGVSALAGTSAAKRKQGRGKDYAGRRDKAKDNAARRDQARVSAEGKTKKKSICTCTDASLESCRTLKTKKKKASKILRTNGCAYSGSCRGFNPCSADPAPPPPGNCAAGQVRCNGACVTGICCAANDCAPRGDFCAGNQCTCLGSEACNSGEVCRLDDCCIPHDEPNQGNQGKCCSKQSASNGICLCVDNGDPDQGDPRNCCSGTSIEFVCCAAAGQDDGGSGANCCSGQSSGGVCTCRPSATIDNGHPGNCCTGFSIQGGCTQPASTPADCTEGSAGVLRGSAWVVCRADADSAWLSIATSHGGVYDPVAACKSIGYDDVGNFGGTGGNVCSAPNLSGGTSCASPGTETYGEAYDPQADYGRGGPGIIGNTVMWECLR